MKAVKSTPGVQWGRAGQGQEKETWQAVNTALRSSPRIPRSTGQPVLPAGLSVGATEGEAWLLSLESFSEPQNCPKMAAWEVGKFCLESI